ncbi:hypothetical protein [Anaeromyxobacter sp. SG64]|uniref:hypothetical protein n=1 Tax=Anaeromyxobacter sp. SG64 TaxID=2925409 RepID=UPI001F576D2B|nr:hypothetical protein [Anaeromyxobacter sp. SG64]
MRLAALVVLAVPSLSLAADPAIILSPSAGDLTEGSLQVTVQLSKGFYDQVLVPNPLADAQLTVVVDGCSTQTFSIQNAADVTPVARNAQGKPVGGWLWNVNADLSGCNCTTGDVRTHHCDGCGRSFDTCSGGSAACAPKNVTLVLTATNKPGNSACTSSSYEGQLVCSVVGVTLQPVEGASSEQWVPANFWDTTSGTPVCISRSNSGIRGPACKPVENHGGNACQ